MKLTTILTLPGATPAEKWDRLKEWAAMNAAWALPTSVAYWAFIRMGVNGVGNDNPGDLKFMEVLDRITDK